MLPRMKTLSLAARGLALTLVVSASTSTVSLGIAVDTAGSGGQDAGFPT
jgi:hypothetical protein